jgi:putative membrane protein
MIAYTRLTAVAALSALAFIQCGGDQKPPETPANEPAPNAEPPSAPPSDADAGAVTSNVASTPGSAEASPASPDSAALSDEQIAAITEAANSAEIAQAKLAQSRSNNPDVKRFAAMMIKHHGAAKTKQAKLKLPTAESRDSSALEADASSTLDTLKKDTGKAFDKAYIDAQVDAHQKVLDTINGKLLPNVKNPELKAYLDEIKPRVEQHLKEAKALQQDFAGKSSSVERASKHSG